MEFLEPLGWRAAWALTGLCSILLCAWCRARQQARQSRRQLRTLQRQHDRLLEVCAGWETRYQSAAVQMERSRTAVRDYRLRCRNVLQELEQDALLQGIADAFPPLPVAQAALCQDVVPDEDSPMLLLPSLHRVKKLLQRGA